MYPVGSPFASSGLSGSTVTVVLNAITFWLFVAFSTSSFTHGPSVRKTGTL